MSVITIPADEIMFRLWLTYGSMHLQKQAQEKIAAMEDNLEVVFDFHNLKKQISLKDMREMVLQKFNEATVNDDEVVVNTNKEKLLKSFDFITSYFAAIEVNGEILELKY